MIIQRLVIEDAAMPGVRLSAEVMPTDGAIMLWVRDGSMPPKPVAAGILLDSDAEADLLAWLQKVKSRDLPDGLCGNRDDHRPHRQDSESLGTFWCHADQSKREPYRSERLRNERAG